MLCDNLKPNSSTALKLLFTVKRDEVITERINSFSTKYQAIIGNNLYEYAINFNYENESSQLKKIIEEEIEFWRRRKDIEIYDINGQETALPANKICIQTKYNAEKLPVYFKIYFQNTAQSSYEINWLEIIKHIEEIKKYNLTYLQDIKELQNEINSVFSRIELTNNSEQQSLLIADFNKKWNPHQLILSSSTTESRKLYEIKDTTGRIISSNLCDNNHTNQPLAIPPSVSFWKKPSIFIAAGTLALGAGAVWYLSKK